MTPPAAASKSSKLTPTARRRGSKFGTGTGSTPRARSANPAPLGGRRTKMAAGTKLVKKPSFTQDVARIKRTHVSQGGVVAPEDASIMMESRARCWKMIKATKEKMRKGEYDMQELSNVRVAVRIRPFHTSEEAAGSEAITRCHGRQVVIETQVEQHIFAFDTAFDSQGGKAESAATQQDVFEALGYPAIEGVFMG